MTDSAANTDHALDALLDKLAHGDPAAAEQVFLQYEPYLRMVVRRQLSSGLRAKFDSMDIVQSVWADVLDGFRAAKWSFEDAAHLRAFLVRATRNRFVDRIRQHNAAVQNERPLEYTDAEAVAEQHATRPSQVVQADELWQQMLDACSPDHRQILNLKRQGLSLDEIAEQTGFHKSSIRRILYELARRLSEKPQNRTT